MNKRKILFAFLVAITIIPFLPSCSQDSKAPAKIRSHFCLNLQGGEKIFYSEINSTLKDEVIKMVDLGDNGKWILKNSSNETRATADFILLLTNEVLTVQIENWNGPFTNTTIILKDGKGKSVQYKGSDVPQKTASFCQFVCSNFSSQFINGLNKLKQINMNAFHPFVYEMFFLAIWSWEIFDPANIALSADRKNDRVELPVDPDFDARFGYPCGKDEVPAKNGKSLIIREK